MSVAQMISNWMLKTKNFISIRFSLEGISATCPVSFGLWAFVDRMNSGVFPLKQRLRRFFPHSDAGATENGTKMPFVVRIPALFKSSIL
jgi:hypothetical protein